ncbi:MAG: ferredoxin:glutaredoxin reductase [Planctomycetes bacterium]|nr:ferredoxin:glutaredoxin reductase [Planctomycetota bacterium]
MINITDEEIQRVYEKLNREAKQSGYNLNPDLEFTKSLIKGLLVNENRYGYWACPCRLASGKKDQDLDIICPCDYRDADLNDYDACYCCLYVSGRVARGEKKATSIPERRPVPEQKAKKELKPMDNTVSSLPLPVWRCKVCGYLCAREEPPETCPICKVKKERFELFIPADK